MPLSKEKSSIDRASVSILDGAGEPPGQPAPLPGILGRVPDELRRLLPDEVIDQLLAGARGEEEIVGPGGLMSQLTKRVVERALEVELTDHLGYVSHQEPPGGVGNTRNGSTPKTLQTEHGPVMINTPRDREGSFEPRLVRKRQRRFEGFDEKILALYSRGLSTRDIAAYLRELYGVEVGRDLISRVTAAVMDDVRAWQTRRRGSSALGSPGTRPGRHRPATCGRSTPRSTPSTPPKRSTRSRRNGVGCSRQSCSCGARAGIT